MSLYDDFDTIKQKDAAGWSSGIKLFQSQLDKLKKTAKTQRKKEQNRKGAALPPVADLTCKRDEDENMSSQGFSPFITKDSSWISGQAHSLPLVAPNRDLEMHVEGEYDPMWPNDYEKVVIELKEKREREKLKEEDEKRKRGSGSRRESRFDSNESDRDRDRDRDRPSGMSARPSSDDEEEGGIPKPNIFGTPRNTGVAIAPPPSLQEPSPPTNPEIVIPPKLPTFGGNSVAAKIMAKYGFKEGQGLGKKEQGIASALQVEKTSKRGGRIINEKAMMPPPLQSLLLPGPGGVGNVAVPAASPGAPLGPPPPATPGTPLGPPPPAIPGTPLGPPLPAIPGGFSAGPGLAKSEPTITEIMRSPSKAVLLRNMVGPGEVDDDLEPEVKDECNSKYGEVVQVIIFEVPNNPADEAVRIFVEFKRIESAIKAVVDLNGRFFGGRQVKAGFYSCEKLKNLQLLD